MKGEGLLRRRVDLAGLGIDQDALLEMTVVLPEPFVRTVMTLGAPDLGSPRWYGREVEQTAVFRHASGRPFVELTTAGGRGYHESLSRLLAGESAAFRGPWGRYQDALARSGQIEAAESLIEDAVPLRTDRADVYRSLRDDLIDRGDLAAAWRVSEQITRLEAWRADRLTVYVALLGWHRPREAFPWLFASAGEPSAPRTVLTECLALLRLRFDPPASVARSRCARMFASFVREDRVPDLIYQRFLERRAFVQGDDAEQIGVIWAMTRDLIALPAR